MKGLLLKDYYLIRSVLFILLVVFVVIGAGMSFLTSTWVLTVIATVMLGMISATTVNIDKSSGWRKTAGVLPIGPSAVVDSKYVLYLLLSGVGFLLGTALGSVVSLVKGQWDLNAMLLFMGISLAMALLAGSVALPCAFLFSEEKSTLGLIVTYPLSALIFVGSVMLFPNELTACLAAGILGAALYGLSWMGSRRFIVRRDIVG
ncbi:MAG TPA: ABC-2 transporter permease [Candidatus Faecaligallichristensenella faecipullorum]|nr:ABC-2 transporter permease [Candidatus Faecaligallichristensenella faecipullorum]